MVKANAVRHPFARLSFADGEVVVTPKDRDIFFISAEKATEACRAAVRSDERFERFENEILVPLYEWCIAHEARIQACYIPVPSGQIQVFFVTTDRRFDFDLAAEMAALELTLANRGWRISISQLPDADPESLATFFNQEGALELYAQRGPAPQEGGE